MPIWYTRPKTVTHPGTNWARRLLTSFMRRTPLTTTPRRQPASRRNEWLSSHAWTWWVVEWCCVDDVPAACAGGWTGADAGLGRPHRLGDTQLPVAGMLPAGRSVSPACWGRDSAGRRARPCQRLSRELSCTLSCAETGVSSFCPRPQSET